LIDNSPNTVIECVVNGIPFLASRTGGILEILPEARLQAKLLFAPNAVDLRRCLDSYLTLPVDELRVIQQTVSEMVQVPVHNAEVWRNYASMAQAVRAAEEVSHEECRSPSLPDNEPLVTACVTYFNLPEFLPETLASLACQTYANLEVVVVNDGSTSPLAIQVFEEQQRLYPQFRFLSCSNSGLGAARNLGLREANGEFFIPIDADNIASPEMVERFVRSINCNPECSAFACYYLAFTSSEKLKRRQFMYAYRPTGGPHVLGSFQNVYGDANGIFRTADLRAVGGYETDIGTTCEDWELFVKLINAGYRLDVIPEHLFYYRYRRDSLYRTTNTYLNQERVLRQYFCMEKLSDADRIGLWTMLMSLQTRDRGHLLSHWIMARRCACCGSTNPWYLSYIDGITAELTRRFHRLGAIRGLARSLLTHIRAKF
jgi:glycosyltransferase involved in cell wall biosynthesis